MEYEYLKKRDPMREYFALVSLLLFLSKFIFCVLGSEISEDQLAAYGFNIRYEGDAFV
jgi:hypothetical protein